MLVNSNSNNIKRFIAVIIISYSYIFSEKSNNMIFVSLFGAVLLFVNFLSSGINIKRDYSNYYITLAAFVVYVFISGKWAVDSSYCKTVGISLIFLILGLFIPLFISFRMKSSDLFNSLVIASLIVALYTIYYYGVGSLIESAFTSNRIAIGFTNPNSLGILFSFSSLIALFEGFIKGKRYQFYIFAFLAFMTLTTGSRKALVVIAIGSIWVALIKAKNRNKIKQMFSVILLLSTVIIMGFVLSRINLFSTMFDRIDGMLAMFSNKNKMDGSTYLRNLYIKVGMNIFEQHQLLGVGMDNSRFYLRFYTGRFTYLHNNFVELLADGGIIGFLLYYINFILCIANYIVKRNRMGEDEKFCLGFAAILLAMDYGMVSYAEKYTWILWAPVMINSVSFKTKDDELYNHIYLRSYYA